MMTRAQIETRIENAIGAEEWERAAALTALLAVRAQEDVSTAIESVSEALQALTTEVSAIEKGIRQIGDAAERSQL